MNEERTNSAGGVGWWVCEGNSYGTIPVHHNIGVFTAASGLLCHGWGVPRRGVSIELQDQV